MNTKPKPDLGILFMAPMVRAILAGQKTVTRRAMKVQPAPGTTKVEWNTACRGFVPWNWSDGQTYSGGSRTGPPLHCRFATGRRLWVRETWRPWVRGWSTHVQYRADGKRGPSLSADASDACMAIAETNGGHWDDGRCQNPDTVKWRPSLHMPRWASRLTLCVTGVRAERLTEITPEDVVLEGLPHAGLGDTPADYRRAYREMHELDADADPWVWRIAFEVVDAG